MEAKKTRTVTGAGLTASLNRTTLIITVVFVLFTLGFELFVFQDYHGEFLRRIGSPDSGVSGLNLVVLPYVAAAGLLCLFVYLSLESHRAISVLYFAFFSLTSLYEFSYQRLFGRFSIAQDLGLAFVTTSTQRADAIGSYVSLWALIPCLAYLGILVLYRPRRTRLMSKSIVIFAAVLAMLFVFHLGMWAKAPRYYFYEAWSYSFGAATRTLFGYTFSRTFVREVEREEVSALPTLPANNIVLVIDESVRGDHLSVNGYPRETTPFLDDIARRDILFTWGIAAAASTRSEESFQHILTGMTTAETGEIWEKLKTYPTLFQYAKAANYRTYYLDGQQNEYWGGNAGDVKFIDASLGSKYFDSDGKDPWDVDQRIADKAAEIIAGSSGNFVVIFKRGSHTPYHLNFPPGSEVWRPSLQTSRRDGNAGTLINTYDNSIRYKLDVFFRSLVGDPPRLPNGTVIIYTSDHGQTLYEGGEIHSHGGESVREATVPLFMIGEVASRPDTAF